MEIAVLPPLRLEGDLAAPYGFNSRADQRLHLDEPLQRQQRFDHRMATGAVPNRMRVLLDLLDEFEFAQL